MTEIKYVGNARLWRMPAHDVSAESGDTIDVDDDVATTLVETDNFEHIDHAVVPDGEPSIEDALAGSVEDLEAALATGQYDDRLDVLEAAEREDKDRQTAFAAIADRREDIRDAQE